MSNNGVLNRSWISPLTMVSFLVVGVTGILLAFHVKSGGIVALHEWIGYLFALAGVIHLLLNWKTFLAYFRRRSAMVALVTGIILSLVVLFAGGVGGAAGGKRGRPSQLVQTFDLDGNGIIDASEVSVAADSLARLDADGDGAVTVQEALCQQGRGGHGGHD